MPSSEKSLRTKCSIERHSTVTSTKNKKKSLTRALVFRRQNLVVVVVNQPRHRPLGRRQGLLLHRRRTTIPRPEPALLSLRTISASTVIVSVGGGLVKAGHQIARLRAWGRGARAGGGVALLSLGALASLPERHGARGRALLPYSRGYSRGNKTSNEI